MERTQHGHGPPVTPEYRTGHTPVKHEKDTYVVQTQVTARVLPAAARTRMLA